MPSFPSAEPCHAGPQPHGQAQACCATHGVGSTGGVASNEKGIVFLSEAYEYMLNIVGVDIQDCGDTVDDIRRIFRDVAEYEARRHNEKVDLGMRKHAIAPEDMPGVGPERLRICHFSDCLLPTDIVRREGTILVNENFVRLMCLLGLKGFKGETGTVSDFFGDMSRGVRSDLYTSILHAVAIHAVRGHFTINDWGFAMFQPDETVAMGERGRNYRYVNLLSMLFYWIICLEHHSYVKDRVVFFMEKYPSLFSELNENEKRRLPDHLVALYFQVTASTGRVFPVAINRNKTGMTREKVEAVLHEHPDSASNEGPWFRGR